jgi:hypothetical protein
VETVTQRCIGCLHLQIESSHCQRRRIKVRKPSATNCASHNQTESTTDGPIIALLDEERHGKSVTHGLPYWRKRRPELKASDSGSPAARVLVYDDGREQYRSFNSVAEYVDAYLDEYRFWATEVIQLPLREQIRLLVVEEWAGDEEWEPHFRRVMHTLFRTDGDNLSQSGSRRAVWYLLECYFECELAAAVEHLLAHTSVMDALSPFIAAARAEIPDLPGGKDQPLN